MLYITYTTFSYYNLILNAEGTAMILQDSLASCSIHTVEFLS